MKQRHPQQTTWHFMATS